jgi:hypothetical protein
VLTIDLYRLASIYVPMSLKKYKVEFRVEKTYEVDVDLDYDPYTEDGDRKLYRMLEDDYEVGNMNNEEVDCQFKIEMCRRVKQ